jgi:hypothetical protein
MKPAPLIQLLNEALENGRHAPGCEYEKTKPTDNLPPNHPKHTQPDVTRCNCWKHRANRMLRSLGFVKRSALDERDPLGEHNQVATESGAD